MTGRALVVWGFGVLVYLMAVLGRSSFGVVFVEAMDQFSINAGQLAVFTTVQLATYAFAQIPAGILIDRFGPRKLLLYGAIVMAIGQVLLGFTESYPVALFARVLVGAGDATAFLSVMRLIPTWFPLNRAPIFGQAGGAIGQLGQFLSAVPFLALVGATSWQTGFYTLGAAGAVVGVASYLFRPRYAPDSKNFGRQPGTTPSPAKHVGSGGDEIYAEEPLRMAWLFHSLDRAVAAGGVHAAMGSTDHDARDGHG